MIRTIEKILPAAHSMLPGEFAVYRALPRRELRRVGGFVFLDHFDHEDVSPDLFDVPPHPHIGLQTVTYLFDGEILHTDSLDYQQKILPGEINWMTAGKGITHSEQVTETQKRVHGIQSWVGLPHKDRKTEPTFENFPRNVLPTIEKDSYKITVIAGECFGEASPIPTFQELVYLDVEANANALIQMPVGPSYELAIYVCSGEVEIDGTKIGKHDLAKLTEGDIIELTANENARFVIIGGEPLAEPTVIYWNFIADTVGEAKQAMIDWEDGKFPEVKLYEKIVSHKDENEKEISTLL